MSETIRTITRDEALSIRDASHARFGGLPGVRDGGLHDSAILQPSQSFSGQELYPILEEKAARLAYRLIKNHAFLDGNKRFGTACLGAMLHLNGLEFRPDPKELLATM